MPSTPKPPPAKNTPKPATTTGKPASVRSTSGIDLGQLFGAAAQALTANQGALNQADTVNGAHGDHMVQTFQLITQAITATQGKPPAEQLANASQMLADHATTSGSAKIYAQGLSQAAQQYQGQKTITPDMAAGLVQTLLGGMQQSGGSAPQPAAGGDLLGQLLGAATGQTVASDPNKLDAGDLINAGMAFMQAKQSGKDNMQSAISALVSASPLSQTPHRQQSGEVVASALFQAISMFGKK
jgi:hypothetical protein